jgi:putative transposase
MPFESVSAMDEKMRFITDYLEGRYSHTELCRIYGISRPTGYKWISRYESEGAVGLIERSRRPINCPHQTPDEIVSEIISLRKKYGWGPKKLLRRLSDQFSDLPAKSTCDAILSRHGLSQKRRRKSKIGHPGNQAVDATAPNQVWAADFKGQFKTRDGRYCYPLTVTDNYSRYLLGCQALPSIHIGEAKPVFKRLFCEYGLPDQILTDNGAPFAARSLGRLSKLSAWWVQLGIQPIRIEPGKPQQNGRHERFHRTLKDRTVRPPSGNKSAQQRRFNHFRKEYNEERPHEALGQETPATFYHPSSKKLPPQPPALVYPNHWEKRKVSSSSLMKWHKKSVHVSDPCAGQYIGLEEIDIGIWNVYLGALRIGIFLEEELQIVDIHGHKKCKPCT